MPRLLLFLALPLAAHDLWIEPTAFAPQPGQIVSVRLRVGQDLIGDPVPRDPSLIQQFILQEGPTATATPTATPIAGRPGVDPAGYFRTSNSGLSIIGYRSHPSSVEMDAAKFHAYLKEEGLAPRPLAGPKTRELFARCAKSLVLTGPATAAQADRALGFPLELIAERNPYVTRDLPFRLLYQQKPLAGALVVAINRYHPDEKLSQRSGPDGRVRFKLPAGGLWLIKAVHMIDAPAGSGADWLSYWASLTFEAPQGVN